MTCVGIAARFTDVAFLWHNVTGAVAVVVIGLLVSLFTSPASRGSDAMARAIVIVVLLLVVAWLVGDMLRSGRKRRGRR